MKYDRIIIGAGLYGLYAALFCSRRGMNVIVLECDKEPFMRATTINQARVHQGYHYPRSLSTAMRSANYFDRFNNDFGFCVNSEFDQGQMQNSSLLSAKPPIFPVSRCIPISSSTAECAMVRFLPENTPMMRDF